MNKIIFTLLLIFGLSISVNAAERETWLCNAFKATSDNSTFAWPFIMYGNRNRYEFRYPQMDWNYVLTYVGQGMNFEANYNIYIGISNNNLKNANAYYIKNHKDYIQKEKVNKNKMTIYKFTVPILDREAHYFETDCIRQ